MFTVGQPERVVVRQEVRHRHVHPRGEAHTVVAQVVAQEVLVAVGGPAPGDPPLLVGDHLHYDASGRKLRSVRGSASTDYVDGIEYEGGLLGLLHMPEGRIVKSGSTYTYEYMLRDHLGNARSGFRHTAPATASLRSDHYPFGLQYPQNVVAGVPVNRYLYNGKELQDGLGIYDYGARLYDPVIARWNAVDPLAEDYDNVSPYIYGMDNPVLMIDPDGMAADTALRKETLLTVHIYEDAPKREPVSGFWGNIDYLFSNGNYGGYHYDRQGNPDGLAPRIGMPPDFGLSKPVSVLKLARNVKAIMAAKKVPLNRLHHIFGKSEHQLEGLVIKFGSKEGAYIAVQKAANKALNAGKLTPNSKGILPSGDSGNIINVGGMNVRLIGGRIQDGQVILSSFSRKGL